MKKNKTEIVTFKADETLMEAIRKIPNRSEFIRNALLQALDSVCPLCMGTGIMTPAQKKHWEAFQQTHTIEECDDCHELHIVCATESKEG